MRDQQSADRIVRTSTTDALPARLLAALSTVARTPDDRLMVEMLEHAILALRVARRLGELAVDERANEAWAWITCDDAAGRRSFVNVCTRFQIDAHALRTRLGAWRREPVPPPRDVRTAFAAAS